MHLKPILSTFALGSVCMSFVSGAQAKPLTQAEIRSSMLGKTIITRRFGLKIRMRYQTNGTVSAKSFIGSTNGTWRPSGNKICTTFPSGPAKGTNCVSFTRTGPDKFRSSQGVQFQVVN